MECRDGVEIGFEDERKQMQDRNWKLKGCQRERERETEALLEAETSK